VCPYCGITFRSLNRRLLKGLRLLPRRLPRRPPMRTTEGLLKGLEKTTERPPMETTEGQRFLPPCCTGWSGELHSEVVLLSTTALFGYERLQYPVKFPLCGSFRTRQRVQQTGDPLHYSSNRWINKIGDSIQKECQLVFLEKRTGRTANAPSCQTLGLKG
jgi:hypothetical protein